MITEEVTASIEELIQKRIIEVKLNIKTYVKALFSSLSKSILIKICTMEVIFSWVVITF